MNLRVVFHDNKEGIIDSRMLDQMISVDKIKMFMRSDGWTMVGINPIRGYGGVYDGIEKRGEFGFNRERAFRKTA